MDGLTARRPMRRPLLAVLVLAASLPVLGGCAGSRPSVVVAPAADDPAALAVWAGGLAVAAGPEVRLVRSGAVRRVVGLPGAVFGLAGRDTLWLATAAGLYALAGPDAEPVAVPLPTRRAAPRVLSVAEGPDGRVWAGTAHDGAFVRAGGSWERVTGASPVGGVAPRPEAVWLATHQGVSRRGADGRDARYTEEGTTEHGLLDNVVDRLWATADGAVWAVHPEGVSVFTDGEPHGYAFVGRRGAQLLDAVALPGGGYVLATTAGVLHVGSLEEKPEGFYEVYADSGSDAAVLAAGRAPAPLAGAAPTRLALSADGGALWFASRDGLWSVPVEGVRSEG